MPDKLFDSCHNLNRNYVGIGASDEGKKVVVSAKSAIFIAN